MIANIMLVGWAIGWLALLHLHRRGRWDSKDSAAVFALVGFPALCVLAARYLP